MSRPSYRQCSTRQNKAAISDFEPVWRVVIWLIGFALSCSVRASPATVTQLDAEADYQFVDVLYAVDKSGEMSFEDARASDTIEWSPLTSEYIDFGITPDTYWYKFGLKNPHDQPLNKLIELAYPLLDRVDFYRLSGTGQLDIIETGDMLPFSQRAIEHRHFLFPVALNPGEQQTIYLRVQTQAAHIVPLTVWAPKAHLEQSDKLTLFHGLYFGLGLSVMIFYMLYFLWLRESMYMFYSLSIGFVLLHFANYRGVIAPFIFSDSPELIHALASFALPGSTIFGTLFLRKFMEIPAYSKGLDVLAMSVIGVMLFSLISYTFLEGATWLTVLMLSALYVCSAVLLIAVIGLVNGYPNSLVVTVSIGIALLLWIYAALSRFGVVPVSFMSEYASQIGSALEALLLSVALSYRVQKEHKDKLAAQEAQLVESDERIKAETDLLHKSLTNPVTQLPNRSCFEQQLKNMISTDEKQRIAVVEIEVTRYTEISKTLGHQNTDMLLHALSQRYDEQLADLPGLIPIQGASSEAFACSLEASSFGVLMDADALEGNMDTIQHFMDVLRKPIEFNGMLLDLHLVTGVAIYPEHGVDAVTLIRHAGVAVDSVEVSDERVARFQPEQDQYNTRRLTMISDLRQAIDQDELELFLQPKYDPKASKVVGVEALLRWQHKLYGYVRPDEFIPMAEKTGIIKALTRWVFKQALVQQNALKEAGYDLNISINISAANLCEQDLVSFMAAELENHNADPQQVYIELTETAMMDDPKSAIAKLEEICELGLKISIDDFGAGYSSLAYLKNLPASEIKIDRALVSGLEMDEGEDSVIQSTIDMCHKLGFTVVAEGVETAEMLKALTALHCDLIQGYLFTPPLPQEQFINWLESHHSDRFAS